MDTQNKDALGILNRVRTFKYSLLLEGICVGIITGAIVGSFRWLLGKADIVRNHMLDLTNQGLTGALILAIVLLALSAIITALLRWEPEIGGSGIPQVEGELKGQIDMKWWKVIPAKFIGCALSIGGGLALGREGPSIQLGAMVGKGFARSGHRMIFEERMLLTCGAGAGLAAAFGAPLAGAIFALEELHQNFSALILITTMAASAVSDWVAIAIVGNEPVFSVELTDIMPPRYFWMLIVLGVLLGCFGALYNRTIDKMQDIFGKLGSLVSNEFLATMLKLVAAFAVAMLMFYVYPTALGSGSYLVTDISEGDYALKALLVLVLIKFIYSTGSFGSGAPGGIFLPLLVLGAITGGVCSRFFMLACGLDEKYITFFVVISMAGIFASIVRAPATGIILITEMTGEFGSFLAMVIVALVSYVVADALGGEPIYEQLWHRRVKADQIKPRGTAVDVSQQSVEKTVLFGDVHMGSFIEGRMVKQLGFPHGSLIVAIIRDGEEFIPAGDTVLYAGDKLEILCRKDEIAEMRALLAEKCQSADI